MESAIVYVINGDPARKPDQDFLRSKLDGLITSILPDDLVPEVLVCHSGCSEQDVIGWLRRAKIQIGPVKDVIRAAMVTVRISTHTNEVSRTLARAHQRLMLKFAHLNDIDLSISR